MFRIFMCFLVLISASSALAQEYKIRPGDVLDIVVLQDSNFNRQVLVRPDGGISMPIAGNIQAANNTISAVESTIVQQLSGQFNSPPDVSVALVSAAERAPTGTSRSTDVHLIGQVGSPGKIRIRRGTTILQVIAEAGGLTEFAARKRIQIRRVNSSGQETIYLFDYDAVERGKLMVNNLPLKAGDVIIVPERKLFEF